MNDALLSLLRSLGGRPVLVAGCGRQGAAAARLLIELGADVLVADDSAEQRVRAALEEAGVPAGAARVEAGGLLPAHVKGRELVVLSAGLPRRHPAIQAAIEAGVPVVNEVEVGAAQLEECVFVAITGTNGKSTTTTILGCLARAQDPDAFVGGNLGEPLCTAVAAGRRPRLAVLELSSYQLETITALSLRVAVVTNLAPDHLDRYESVDAYYEAKARLLDLVEESGTIVLNVGDPQSRRVLVPRAKRRRFDFNVLPGTEGVALEGRRAVVRAGEETVAIDLDHPHLVGRHNLENAAAALAAAAALGIPPQRWKEGLQRYEGIEHRLECVGEHAGVAWFNDSKATNVDAAITAVRSFERGVHLIAGGRGKGAPYAPLVEAARGRVRAVYTIGEDGPAIAAAFAGAAPVVEAGTLERAVREALAAAEPGDVILLSPACASFDQFPDFRARGEAFRRLFEKETRA